MRRLRIGLAQMNPTVGDIEGNLAKIRQLIEHARSERVDIIAFPELAITGYPPEDLLLRSGPRKAGFSNGPDRPRDQWISRVLPA